MSSSSTGANARGTRKGTIVVVSEFVTSVNSTGYYWSQIVEKLRTSFGGVRVWTSQSIDEVNKRWGSEKTVRTATVLNPWHGEKALLPRILGEMYLAASFFVRLMLSVGKHDVVVSGTNPALLIPVIALLQKLRRFKWLLVVYDVFPENLGSAGLSRMPKTAGRLLKLVFDWAYRSATRVIVIGRDMEALVKQKGVSPGALVVRPNWAAPSDSRCGDDNANPARSISRNDQTVNFQFFGNMGRVQGIETLLAAIDLVRAPNASFEFIGAGAMAHLVKERAARAEVHPITYLGPRPMSESSSILSSCDVSIVSLADGMYGLGVPSKAYFALAENKPLLVIAHPDSEIALMVKEHNIGWVCSPGDLQDIATTIDKICAGGLDDLEGGPLDVLNRHYSPEVALSSYVETINALKID
ncbi:glycosyltransferase family 4 protein [Luteimonas sp. FXH3W]|uniref:Glycosyltransferase family 4 protein n=1 Tax=Aquilutibacter rugosus TaxID=3115820 RepID=A0ABU7UYR9_9GAMM